MSTQSISLNVYGKTIVLTSAQEVDEALKAGYITNEEQAFALKILFTESAKDLDKGVAVQSAETQPLTLEQQQKKNELREQQQKEIADMKEKHKAPAKPAWVRFSSKSHSKDANWYRATQRGFTNFDAEFKNKSVDELVSRLGGFSAKGPLSTEKAQHLKEILIRQNPSVFNRDGSIKTNADYTKLDIPNVKWLQEEFPA